MNCFSFWLRRRTFFYLCNAFYCCCCRSATLQIYFARILRNKRLSRVKGTLHAGSLMAGSAWHQQGALLNMVMRAAPVSTQKQANCELAVDLQARGILITHLLLCMHRTTFRRVRNACWFLVSVSSLPPWLTGHFESASEEQTGQVGPVRTFACTLPAL